jgi:hypothetical protein
MRVIDSEYLSVGDMVKDDRLERKPLPIGKTQALEWSDRIITGAAVDADKETQRFALMGMLMQIATTEAFREDAYFMLALRVAAVKQTAHLMAQELKEAHDAKKKQAEATAPTIMVGDGGVLADQKL